MLVLLDSNVFFSALLKGGSRPARIVDAWLEGSFRLLCCQQQIDEIRVASHHPKLRGKVQPHEIGTLLNNLYRAEIWTKPIPRRHEAADPTDSFLLNLIEAAQPDYAVTGDKRSGLLEVAKLGRTRILTVTAFCSDVLRV